MSLAISDLYFTLKSEWRYPKWCYFKKFNLCNRLQWGFTNLHLLCTLAVIMATCPPLEFIYKCVHIPCLHTNYKIPTRRWNTRNTRNTSRGKAHPTPYNNAQSWILSSLMFFWINVEYLWAWWYEWILCQVSGLQIFSSNL